MRNIKIKRIASFVGKFYKTKIYVEDAEKPEIKINKVPCRLLGVLKNGEEKTFEIPAEAVKIFAVPSKYSKVLSNDFINLQPGEDEVFITGSIHLNGCGIAFFRFDGDVKQDTLSNRKRIFHRGIWVYVCSFILGLVLALSVSLGLRYSDKTFTKWEMSITLTGEFQQKQHPFYSSCYVSDDIAITTTREGYSYFGISKDSWSLTEYAKFILELNHKYDYKINETDGFVFFEWWGNHPTVSKQYKYLGVAYKSDEAFWLIQFGTENKKYDGYKEQFLDWAKTVKFE